jgi:arsenate reductase (thioredoxin)
MRKDKVLFLCTGNSARSQMAEALLRHHAGDRFEAYSAGLEPKGIHPLTRQVLEELGMDISEQRSKSLREYMGQMHFEYLITVCHHAEQNCPTTFLGFGKRYHWSFEDPAAFEGSESDALAKFRTIRDEIDQRIQDWIAERVPQS